MVNVEYPSVPLSLSMLLEFVVECDKTRANLPLHIVTIILRLKTHHLPAPFLNDYSPVIAISIIMIIHTIIIGSQCL